MYVQEMIYLVPRRIIVTPGDARCDSRQPCAMRVIIGFRAVSVSQALRSEGVFLLISRRDGDVG